MKPKIGPQHRRCRVVGCRNQKHAPAKNTSLFVVRKEQPLFEKWVQSTGQDELLDLPIQFLRNNLYICEEHFLPSDICNGPHMKRLKQNALPFIFHEGHKPLSNEAMTLWRNSKQYLSYYKESENVQPGPSRPANSFRDAEVHKDETSLSVVSGGNPWAFVSESQTDEAVNQSDEGQTNMIVAVSEQNGALQTLTERADASFNFGESVQLVAESPVLANLVYLPVLSSNGGHMEYVPFYCVPVDYGKSNTAEKETSRDGAGNQEDCAAGSNVVEIFNQS